MDSIVAVYTSIFWAGVEAGEIRYAAFALYVTRVESYEILLVRHIARLKKKQKWAPRFVKELEDLFNKGTAELFQDVAELPATACLRQIDKMVVMKNLFFLWVWRKIGL